MNKQITVELVYAPSHEKQIHKTFEVPIGSTIREAIEKIDLFSTCPELNWETLSVGIFEWPKSVSDVLEDGDRIVIYTLLRNDPKLARHQRVKEERRK